MRIGLCLFLVVVGVVLRVLSMGEHEHPRGDVVLDVGVTRSLAAGDGFASGFDRGTAFVVGDGPIPVQDRADQHGPLWPLFGALFVPVTDSPFAALKLASLLGALCLLILVGRTTDRLCEGLSGAPDGLPAVAMATVALGFVAIDAGGNGSLYGTQAALMLLLIDRLARPGLPVIVPGVVLGALWLLNHQAALLLPVPLLARAWACAPGTRGRGAWTGVLITLVAAAVQLPWWIRNVQVFGDPLYSVNATYFLYKAGVEPVFGMEGGVSVARFPEPTLGLLVAIKTWLLPNALYLLSTGLLLLPGALAVSAAGGLPLLGEARRRGDVRLAGLILVTAVLAGAALLWPDTKLRYLVGLVPLVTVLAVRLFATPTLRFERLLGVLFVLGWGAVLALTLGDLTGTEDNARPERWTIMAAGGLFLVALPLALRHRLFGGEGLRVGLVSGVFVVPLVTVLIWCFTPVTLPLTTYHSSWLTPDFFGGFTELRDERDARGLERAREPVRSAGIEALAGPMGWLEFDDAALVRLPYGVGTVREEALAVLLDAGAVDGVLTLTLEGWPEGLAVGERWLGGRLEVVAVFPDDEQARGSTLSRAVDQR